MRPIDADTLLELPELVDCEKIDTARVRKDIVNAPTVDAVPVVRCGECVFRNKDGFCIIHKDHPTNSAYFCATGAKPIAPDGERKDGEK